MISLEYLWAKFFKRLKGIAILDSNIHKTSIVAAGSQVHYCSIGRYTSNGYDCKFINVDIGSFCSIANNVVIGDSMHPVNWVSTSPVFYNVEDSIKKKFSKHEFRSEERRTSVGNDVWIGNNVLVKQGVTIGSGSIIGMGSIVTKDIPPYAIYAGNPARLLRFRFSQETIDMLIELKWWDYDDDSLEEIAQYFRSVDQLSDYLKK